MPSHSLIRKENPLCNCCAFSGRPHKLLVIVNPFSGGRTGKKIFEKQVAPLFAKAMIDTEVVGEYILSAAVILYADWSIGVIPGAVWAL